MESAQFVDNPKFEIKEANDFKTIYANHANVTMSTFDVSIDFGQFTANILKGDSEIPITLLTRIVMSPQHGKALAKVLIDHINKYEKDYGTINIEPLKK
jgi:hypothetical protein